MGNENVKRKKKKKTKKDSIYMRIRASDAPTYFHHLSCKRRLPECSGKGESGVPSHPPALHRQTRTTLQAGGETCKSY